MVYNVLLTKNASRELDGLPRMARDRVLAILSALAADPRPRGCVKLKVASGDAWRVRAGPYRILYSIDDRAHEVRVFRLRHRRDAYRTL